MPELPDVTVYVEHLRTRIVGEPLRRVRLGSPFVLRSVTPPLGAAESLPVRSVDRLGKRIVITLDGGLSLVIHLMIAGRLRWRPPRRPHSEPPGLGRVRLSGRHPALHRGGRHEARIAPRGRRRCGAAAARPRRAGGARGGRRGLPRVAPPREPHGQAALTDPRLFSGIGNAYSDEILHAAGLSPLKWTTRLSGAEIDRLFQSARATLADWTERLRRETGNRFPEKVTAFHEGMAVHGRYGRPCPTCGSPVQRILYASNEANYCPRCQTGGRLLADRSLSRLLGKDWPRSLDELDDLTASRRLPDPGAA